MCVFSCVQTIVLHHFLHRRKANGRCKKCERGFGNWKKLTGRVRQRGERREGEREREKERKREGGREGERETGRRREGSFYTWYMYFMECCTVCVFFQSCAGKFLNHFPLCNHPLPIFWWLSCEHPWALKFERCSLFCRGSKTIPPSSHYVVV